MNNVVPPDCKDCVNDCKIYHGMAISTTAYYPPVYDKNGVNLNLDGNILSGSCKCLTCDQEWRFSVQYGKIDWQRIYTN